MQLRSFRNSDTPRICQLWHQHPELRGKFRGLTPAVFERVILSKTYFDPEAFCLAWVGDHLVGFVHAACGIAEDQQRLDPSRGLISQLVLQPGPTTAAAAPALLEYATEYLRTRGATHIEFGGYFPLSPFYLGLYGGSRGVGVLADDPLVGVALQAAGFEAYGRVIINHWRLSGFRQVIDRRQLLIGRSYALENVSDCQPQTWLQACHYDAATQKVFQLKDKRSGEIVGKVAFWEMDPLVQNWGQNGMGLVELEVAPQWRRTGLATYMVGESLRQLKHAGVGLIEIQHLDTDLAVASLCQKLDFTPIDSTVLYRKPL